MILCCGIPIVGILVLSTSGLLGSWGYYALLVICPVGHLLMMRGMHSNSEKTMVPRQIEYKKDESWIHGFSWGLKVLVQETPVKRRWQNAFNITEWYKILAFVPQCGYKGKTFEKMNPVLIKSGIPDIPHWVKQLYMSCLGVLSTRNVACGVEAQSPKPWTTQPRFYESH